MKPAPFAWSIAFFLAACAPTAAAPTVTIATSPHAEPPPTEPPPAPVAQVAAEPSSNLPLDAVRDERRLVWAPRPVAELVPQIQSLESTFGATPRASPDRPSLMRRLADGYVELAQAAQQFERPPKSEKIARAAHAAAIKYYYALVLE